MLAGRHIVLGVTGGIAAYKSAYIARRLMDRGASVRPVMTDSATRFLGPPTLAALTGTQPVVGFFDEVEVSPHTELASWADAVVIAPATAATLARIAHGESSEVLTGTVLATTAPVIVAPAMHTEMWEHDATQENIRSLRSLGYHIVPPEEGALAGGDMGVGRLADPDTIIDAVDQILEPGDMEGLSVIITAGGTREPIDPVRYIGNRSSGKMGNSLAEAAAERGADVTLVTTAAAPEHPSISVIRVETAQEMADTVWSIAPGHAIAVMAAAVADFRPVLANAGKLRRAEGPPTLTLEPTPDVLAGVVDGGEVGVVVGFAAEVGSLDEAVAKAQRKGVDLLVGNDIARDGSGFGSDTNEVVLITSDGTATSHPLLPKRQVADIVWDAAIQIRGRS